MAETPTPHNKEAFNAFVKQYNLDPLNKDAIMNCLFELKEENNIAHARIDEMQQAINKLEAREDGPLMEIYDKAIGYLKRIKELESK